MFAVANISCSSFKEYSNESENAFMKLNGKITLDSLAKFELKVQRIKSADGEYLPNSEDFRVEIYDNELNLIFSSNFEQNYMMAIGKVEPVEVGETKSYAFEWNYLSNFSKQVSKGKYLAKLIIPAEPENYFVDIDFEI